jgi:hypothetical protein
MYTQDELSKLSDEEKKKQRRNVQMEMAILESDLRKSVARKNELETIIRRLKYEEERVRVEMDANNKEFHLLSQKVEDIEAEIKRLKKKLNFLVSRSHN